MPELEVWLCPIHKSIDDSGGLKKLDNCVACLRNERDELKRERDALWEQIETITDALPESATCKHPETGMSLIDNIRYLVRDKSALNNRLGQPGARRMSTPAICNMIGSVRCGREITGSEVAYTAGSHINRGNGKCEWKTLIQCRDCAAKEQLIRESCDPRQRDWCERRRAVGMSLGEMARKLGLGPAAYSGMEHLRSAASANLLDDFDAALGEPAV